MTFIEHIKWLYKKAKPIFDRTFNADDKLNSNKTETSKKTYETEFYKHIKLIDEKFGGKLLKQYPSNDNAVIKAYFNRNDIIDKEIIKFDDKYTKKVISLIKNGNLDFDHYCDRLA